jgi:hypothetical protein
MPNGGTWDRFWFVIMGFHEKYGHWPTRVIATPWVRDAIWEHLSSEDRGKLESRLKLVSGDPLNGLAAEDDEGAAYDYAGPAGGGNHSERFEWFGIDWD